MQGKQIGILIKQTVYERKIVFKKGKEGTDKQDENRKMSHKKE